MPHISSRIGHVASGRCQGLAGNPQARTQEVTGVEGVPERHVHAEPVRQVPEAGESSFEGVDRVPGAIHHVHGNVLGTWEFGVEKEEVRVSLDEARQDIAALQIHDPRRSELRSNRGAAGPDDAIIHDVNGRAGPWLRIQGIQDRAVDQLELHESSLR
jgi:hypothetical protein